MSFSSGDMEVSSSSWFPSSSRDESLADPGALPPAPLLSVRLPDSASSVGRTVTDQISAQLVSRETVFVL